MTRILMTGSRGWTDARRSTDALNAAVGLLEATHAEAVLVHGAASGADELLARAAAAARMPTEAHPAQWQTHTAACPPAHAGQTTCRMAGHRRNADMVALGADLCLAFPMHPKVLPAGASTKESSRGTWSCVDKAVQAGIPTVIVWGEFIFPIGDAGARLLAANAASKGQDVGPNGQMRMLDAWLPF